MAYRPRNVDQIMENSASFDLNREIEQWRASLAIAPAFRGENLDELESHLRDSVATLQSRGLSEDEAFLIATRRVGQSSRLEPEFRKVNGTAVWLDRLFWMVIGYQVWLIVSGVVGVVSRNAVFFGLSGAGYDFKAHGYIAPVALLAWVQLAGFAGSLALCWWLFRWNNQRFGSGLRRLLQRRTTWALTFIALYALALSTGVASGGIQALLARAVGPERFSELAISQNVSSALTQLVTTAVLVWLTLFLAGKRFLSIPARG